MIGVALLTSILAGPALPAADVRDHLGAPTLFINGEPHPGTSYMTYHPDPDNFAAIGRAGVHLYSFSATPTESTYNLAPECWTAPDTFDYTHMDERAHMVLDNDPDAWFFPRLFLGTPPWWAEAHPDDLVTFDPGTGAPEPFVLRGKRVASWASEQWRTDTATALRRFIRHVEASDYGHRVIGYHLASGTTEEWMQWGSNEDQWTDYCPANAGRFRAWLRERYQTEARLQQAWNDLAVTFDTASIPTREQRAHSERGYLRNPATAQSSIDYVQYTSWLVADTIRHFARVTKDAVDEQRLVGVFYGYLLALSGAQREQNAGHLALHDVLTCPDIDFMTSPCNYTFRQLGTGFPHAMSLADSVKHHGKLWIDENDFRTWLTPNVPVGQFGKTATYEESLLCQQREFGWVMASRIGMWWFDMGGGWYDDPRMLAEIGAMNRIAHENTDAAGDSVAEIAFVIDCKTGAFLKPGNPYSWPALILQLPELGRVGAPFAIVDLADLADLPPYKLYILPNCFAPTQAERDAIARCLARDGASALWIGPAGAYRDGRLDESGMKALTGWPLALQDTPLPWRVIPTDEAEVWGWRDTDPFGPGRPNAPLALPDSHDGITLGVLEDGTTPAVVARDQGSGVSVFSAVPQLPAPLIRAVAHHAGVHLYIDTPDIVWASRGILAISVNEAGPRTVRLPAPRRVTDLWTGKAVADNADTFTIDIPAGGTALSRLD
ncbi:MAG: hypothetical protein GY851_29350 [bacterium]|nr:hypothetical protein [bacterium]